MNIVCQRALEDIFKASNTLMKEIDTYERECMSSWADAKESNKNVVEDVSKRMKAFLDEQQAYLQTVQASDTDLIVLFFNFLDYS